jgi:hypothetical protein
VISIGKLPGKIERYLIIIFINWGFGFGWTLTRHGIIQYSYSFAILKIKIHSSTLNFHITIIIYLKDRNFQDFCFPYFSNILLILKIETIFLGLPYLVKNESKQTRIKRKDFLFSSSQIASRIEPGDLFVFQHINSTQIHLWIGMGFLFNVTAKTTQKGFFCYL